VAAADKGSQVLDCQTEELLLVQEGNLGDKHGHHLAGPGSP
jgi:hypothetical protein